MKCPDLVSSVQWDHMLLYPACSQSQYTYFLAQLDEEYLIRLKTDRQTDRHCRVPRLLGKEIQRTIATVLWPP